MSKIKFNDINSRWEFIDDSGIVRDYAVGSQNSNPWDLTWNTITVKAGGSVDATATSGDILMGETAVARGKKITGTMPNNGSLVITPSTTGSTYDGGYYSDITVFGITEPTENSSVRFGYWTADGKVQEVDLSGNTPVNYGDAIAINAITFITGKPSPDYCENGGGIVLPEGITVSPEHVLDGVFYIDATGEKQEGTMPKLTSKTYTPTNKNQTISAGKYIDGAQTIMGDSNLVSGNIKKDVTIFGVTGTYTTDTTTGVDVYKCLTVDVGNAYGPYQDVNISGVTSPVDLSGDYIVTDPTDMGTSRIFRQGNYQLGYDHNNKAWCINEGDSDPDYISSVFYSKLEGFSTEEGTFANPIWWDSEGVATSDRTITGDYNTSDAPYDDYTGYGGWNFYVRLKAGEAYTIGINCPTDNEDYGYDPYLYLKDTSGNTIASGASGESLTIGDKEITFYLTYTPTEDGLFVIQVQEEMNSLDTPIACSPAPEISQQPASGLFEQTNWKVGGGNTPGVRVVSAGTDSCIGDYTLIQGDGKSFDSIWQNPNGVYIRGYGDGWCMSESLEGLYIFRTDTNIDTTNGVPHPATVKWDTRYSSSYGDLPIVTLLPAAGVSGIPALTPIERQGREALGYAVWSGEIMQQDDNGAWNGTGEIKSNMQTSRFVPVPGNIYNDTGDTKIEAYKGIKNAVYSMGNTQYKLAAHEYVPELLTDLRFEKIVAGNNFIFGIDKDGYMYSMGVNGSGQLGLGDASNRTTLTKVNDKTWRQVSCGLHHTVAIDTDGYLWATGLNSSGQLCDGTTSSSYQFKQIGLSKWKFVFCHYNRTFLIDENDNMWGVGQNNYGSLGSGDSSDKGTLTKLNDNTWKSICGNNYRTFAIDTDGYLWGAGYNSNNALGISESYAYTFTKIGDQKYKMVATGDYHTIAINIEGYMYVWGQNNVGMLGTGDNESHSTPFKNGNKKWLSVGATYLSSFAVDIYGRAYWFGDRADYLVPYRSKTPQPFNIPGNCTDVALYDSYNIYLLVNE